MLLSLGLELEGYKNFQLEKDEKTCKEYLKKMINHLFNLTQY